MGLQQFERRLERLVEGAFAKAFRSGLQPVELGRRLTREMDLGRAVGVRGVIAPNHFTFRLAEADLERFATFSDTLVRELREAGRQHAKDEDYLLMGPVEVGLEAAPGVTKGTFDVVAETVEGVVEDPAFLVLPDGHRVAIASEAVVIGRSGDCQVLLPETDKAVSRRHAEVRREADGFVLEDLKSLNGTKVNGAGVRQWALQPGDKITIGSTTLRFEA
ncbi:MAG TPA: DUF3662 and FHA domain-containing protein [Acidimicrobiales bacterium]|nr:DUF3662 and FHA domain-containing protein [Acidimicrobiales bacterium]